MQEDKQIPALEGTKVDSLFESLGENLYREHHIFKEMTALRLEILGIEGKPAKFDQLHEISKQVLEDLPLLEQLEIEYEPNAIQGPDMEKIGEYFSDANVGSLRECFFDFYETNQDPKHLFKFFENLCKNDKPSLEQFGVWLNAKYQTIAPIALAFKNGKLKSIKKLQFIFESSELKDENDFEEFAYNLATAGFTQLENLRLNFSENQYKNGLGSFIKGFVRAKKEGSQQAMVFCKNMKKLQLEFQNNKMEDEGFIEFGKLLHEAFENLDNIMLDLEENLLTKNGLKGFAEGIKASNFTKLRRMVFDLNDNKGLTGGFREFGKLLSESPCLGPLEVLWLECERSDLVDDDLNGFLEHFCSLKSAIKDLKKLKILEFQNKFTEANLDLMADAFETGNLRNCLILDFQVNNPDFKTVKADKFKIIAPKWMKHAAMYFRFCMLSQSNNVQYSIINQGHFFLDSDTLKFADVAKFIEKRQWKYQAAFASYEYGKDQLQQAGYERFQTITTNIIANQFDLNY